MTRAVATETAGVLNSARSAVERSGPERDTLAQSLKAAGAAIAAWAVTGWWLQAPMALLAPWTAIAMVSSTVYQSVRPGAQQVVVIGLGTLWASAAMAVTDANVMPAMALTLPFMMLIGNYHRFGTQGIYGATTALFVITYGTFSASDVGHRLLETLIGATLGILVNAFVPPPVHLRSVQERLRVLTQEAGDVLDAVARGVREEDGMESAGDWQRRASQLAFRLEEVSDARRWANEGSRLNPGGRLRRTGPPPPSAEVDALWGRVCGRIQAVTRTLSGISTEQELPAPSPAFLERVSRVMECAARVCRSDSDLFGSADAIRTEPVCNRRSADLEEASTALDALTEEFRTQEGTAAAVAGELLVESRQLLREMERPFRG